MSIIEFNERAKPLLAPSFGGALQEGHYYQLKNGSTVQAVPAVPPLNMPGAVCCLCLDGAYKGSQKWWMPNGLFWGSEFDPNYKWHIVKEVPAPAPKLSLQLGQQYKTKSGYITSKMEIHLIDNPEVGGPVLKCHFYKQDGKIGTATFYYNVDGLYLGDGMPLTYPKGNHNSVRCIAEQVL